MNHGGYLLEYQLYLQRHANSGRPPGFLLAVVALPVSGDANFMVEAVIQNPIVKMGLYYISLKEQ